MVYASSPGFFNGELRKAPISAKVLVSKGRLQLLNCAFQDVQMPVFEQSYALRHRQRQFPGFEILQAGLEDPRIPFIDFGKGPGGNPPLLAPVSPPGHRTGRVRVPNPGLAETTTLPPAACAMGLG
jgi:hypothetical protein